MYKLNHDSVPPYTGVTRAISTIERGVHDGADHRLQTSKSETSLVDSDAFVLISESEVREAQQTIQEMKSNLPKNPLMPGEPRLFN